MKICKSCGHMNNDNASFCVACGTKIEDSFNEATRVQEKVEIRCPNCGLLANNDDSFCVNCGTKLKNKSISNSGTQKNGYNTDQWGRPIDPNSSNKQSWHNPKVNTDRVYPQGQVNSNDNSQKNMDQNKTIKGGALGFVLAFFLGIIGLIITLVLGDKAARKAAVITFVVSILIIVGIFIAYTFAGLMLFEYESGDFPYEVFDCIMNLH